MPSYIAAPSAVEDVGAGCRDDREQPAAAELLRCRLERATPIGQPRRQIGPPGALLGLGGPEPFGRVGRVVLVELEARLRVAWWVDQSRDVPAGRQHEA